VNVLLISIQRNLDNIGLKGLHHLLLEHGHASHLLYLPRFEAEDCEDRDGLTAFVKEVSPDLIGVSLMALDFVYARAATGVLKAAFPEIPVVWGGIHPTTMPEMCLDYADYLCIGEGEQTLLDLVSAIEKGAPVTSIQNLCYREGGELKRNPLYPLITDLDALPLVRQIPPKSFVQIRHTIVPLQSRHLRRYKRWAGGVYKILTSRGCPYACAFCTNNFLRGLYGWWGVRRRSVDHVMRELEYAAQEGPPLEYVDFSDDCFLACEMDYLEDFCRQYEARVHRPFIAKGTPRYLTREKLDRVAGAGLAWINLGLQSGSVRVCEEVYHRNIAPEAFLAAARLIHEYRVAPYYDVIVDNPYETLEDSLQTVEILTQTPRPFFPLIFSLTVYYGTELHARIAADRPGQRDISLRKNYEIRESTAINDLIELAGILHPPLMRALTALFRRNPAARTTRAALFLAKAYARAVLYPITYFRLILRTQNGSVWRTLRVLPVYLDHGIVYYLNNFDWFKKRPRPA
jgi:radical SAM superfamily enzyme YgiQ (UPF0313 family)